MLKYFDINIFAVFFPVNKSQNVIARFVPVGETKNILIFSAHIDSAYVVRIYDGKLREYAFRIKKIFKGLFIFLLIISLFSVINFLPSVVDYLYLLPFAGLGLAVYYQNLTVTWDKSFGANDNLSGISILIGLAQYFAVNKPENIEIRLCAFGAEETGLTGSKHFVKTHFKEIKNRAKVINIDAVSGGALYVIAKESESGIKHSRSMINIINQSAQKAGISIYEKVLEDIGTDAASFSFEEIPATTLLSLDKYGIPLRYHVKEDLPQYISEEQLQDIYKICIEAAELIDERPKTE